MSASYASVSYDIFLQTKFISSLLEKSKKTCIVCQKCPANSPTIPLDVLSFHLTTAHLIHCGHKCVYCFCKFQWRPPKEVGIKVQTSYLTFVKHRYECLQNLLQVSSCVATQEEDVFSRRPAIRLQLQTDANSYFLLGKRKTLDWRLPDAQMLRIQTLDKKQTKCKFTRHASPMEELPSFPNSETRETMEKLPSFQNNETRDTMEKLPSFQNNETLETTPEHINRQASEVAKEEECKRLRKQLDETQDALQDAHQQLLYIQDLLQEIQEDLVEPSANDTISWIFKKMLTL